MPVFWIFIWVYAAMIAMAFWEAYVEGRNAWAKGKLGWQIKLGNYVLTGYHFFIFAVMWPLMLTLPLVIYGWDTELFGILVSAYFSGLVIEDFMWYVVNPAVKFSELNTDFANYYPRLKIGKVRIPIFYFVGIGMAVVSWLLLWK
ncbi:hypothetical protein C4546_01300 [Candidatus Parcubacteria bacterium]|jgi:hypothetical protein|nr:MAG: hypothetical protein C4546_01300 [Candidatus Parcubacteria bacterium]